MLIAAHLIVLEGFYCRLRIWCEIFQSNRYTINWNAFQTSLKQEKFFKFSLFFSYALFSSFTLSFLLSRSLFFSHALFYSPILSFLFSHFLFSLCITKLGSNWHKRATSNRYYDLYCNSNLINFQLNRNLHENHLTRRLVVVMCLNHRNFLISR